jgi:upstream activation factor subunit UAF30
MPRKATQSKSTNDSTKDSTNEIATVNEEKNTVNEKKNNKKVVKKVKETETVKEPEPVKEPELSDVEGDVEDSEKKSRQVLTKESVSVGFDELVSVIDEEIERLRENQQKSKGVKFLRSLGKKLKTLKSVTVRVMKQKTKTNRKNNTNSGFLKPVKISQDMAKFTGWKSDDLKSRVDVTKFICNYIRENNLQNPEDRRQILADKKLSKLLDYQQDDKPLTYYRIQTYMKKHFTNPDVAVSHPK